MPHTIGPVRDWRQGILFTRRDGPARRGRAGLGLGLGRQAGLWQTASTFTPSGSSTKAA